MKRLLTYHDAVKTRIQHTKPCSDCPWARVSLPGWLGQVSAEDWLALAHGEGICECHATDKLCAGFAIFRANVCKVPRDPGSFRLPADKVTCFSSNAEFLAHHKREK